jgi:hypothetical protein
MHFPAPEGHFSGRREKKDDGNFAPKQQVATRWIFVVAAACMMQQMYFCSVFVFFGQSPPAQHSQPVDFLECFSLVFVSPKECLSQSRVKKR